MQDSNAILPLPELRQSTNSNLSHPQRVFTLALTTGVNFAAYALFHKLAWLITASFSELPLLLVLLAFGMGCCTPFLLGVLLCSWQRKREQAFEILPRPCQPEKDNLLLAEKILYSGRLGIFTWSAICLGLIIGFQITHLSSLAIVLSVFAVNLLAQHLITKKLARLAMQMEASADAVPVPPLVSTPVPTLVPTLPEEKPSGQQAQPGFREKQLNDWLGSLKCTDSVLEAHSLAYKCLCHLKPKQPPAMEEGNIHTLVEELMRRKQHLEADSISANYLRILEEDTSRS
ncbi:MAG TPA: hypothetical protein PLC15_00250 [Candidatus Obscuribacter sp.]|nr:hypothetical protein [Candidatus Obscuribacter sp.]HMY04840.1 hypothetical protein [Candidatus Obscuribacter sp.]HMY55431.1 hypothetical protein [Candidatus Obscuribacter sp.]HNB13773.1 hypothetical protein [Candidatus Obscuribacter sp.]HND07348.1 hypothetical protein [Candidatus Obscuribacter sp.]